MVLSFRTRVSLLCTALASALLLALGGVWLAQTRNGIHEEIEAANRVAGQWLAALEQRSLDHHALAEDEAVALLRQVGRVRANDLEAFDADGRLRYRGPEPSYKAGRQAPAWFAALLQPDFPAHELPLGPLTVRLSPDASRAVLDAWDDLAAMAGWALVLLGLLFLAARRALDRTLQPLEDVMAALEETGRGQFATRLPTGHRVRELQGLAASFNAMNDRLDAALRSNVRLQSETAVSRRIAGRLEEERRAIARELHDELAQGITAVRTLAGVVVRLGRDQAPIHGAAQSILAVAGEMQQGVRAILQRLRPAAADGLARALEEHLLRWRQRHPDIAVSLDLEPEALAGLDAEQGHVLLRMVQEGLTNAARHALPSRVWIALDADERHFRLDLRDDGRGFSGAEPRAGFGLCGLRERLALAGGELSLGPAPEGGLRLLARLPRLSAEDELPETLRP